MFKISDPAIVDIVSADGCQKAVKELDVDNTDVIEENQPSVPRGCYLYVPENKLYFNEHPKGLAKGNWTKDTRKVCHNFKEMLKEYGGNIIIS